MFLASIAERYRTCYINTPVLVKNFYDTGITVNWRETGLQNPELGAAYYAFTGTPRPGGIRLRYMVAYVAIAHYAGYKSALPKRLCLGITSLSGYPICLDCLSEQGGKGYREVSYRKQTLDVIEKLTRPNLCAGDELR